MRVRSGVVRKLLLGCSLGILTIAALTGCGNETAKAVDVKALGENLNSGISYQDQLVTIDFDIASQIYDFEDIAIKDSVFYEGSGATAEEIVVVECEKKEDVSKLQQVLTDRVEEQKQSFQDYVPAELDKLNEAVVMTKGNYAVLSISNEPDKAKDIIDKAFK